LRQEERDFDHILISGGLAGRTVVADLRAGGLTPRAAAATVEAPSARSFEKRDSGCLCRDSYDILLGYARSGSVSGAWPAAPLGTAGSLGASNDGGWSLPGAFFARRENWRESGVFPGIVSYDDRLVLCADVARAFILAVAGRRICECSPGTPTYDEIMAEVSYHHV
jgi:hypothetical protein